MKIPKVLVSLGVNIKGLATKATLWRGKVVKWWKDAKPPKFKPGPKGGPGKPLTGKSIKKADMTISASPGVSDRNAQPDYQGDQGEVSHAGLVKSEPFFDKAPSRPEPSDSQIPQIPTEVSMQKREKAYAQKPGLDSKKVLINCANNLDPATEVCPLKGSDGKDWKAVSVRNGKVHFNRTSPTWERGLGGEEDNHLTNIYIHLSDEGHLSISCGVIDTVNKAEEFMLVIEEVYKQFGGERNGYNGVEFKTQPLRISLHQFNSNINEGSKIKRQMRMATYINKYLPGRLEGLHEGGVKGPIVSYSNRTLNGFTRLDRENKKGRENNLQGVATQALWLYHDLEASGNFVDSHKHKGVDQQFPEFKKIEKLMGEIQGLKEKFLPEEVEKNPQYQKEVNKETTIMADLEALSLEELLELMDPEETLSPEETQELQKVKGRFDKLKKIQEKIQHFFPEKISQRKIKKKEKELKTLLIALKKNLSLERTIDLGHDAPRLPLLAKIIDYELIHPSKYSPTQKLMFEMVQDIAQRAVAEHNCFSGIDRAGFARTVKNALIHRYDQAIKEKEMKPQEAIYDLMVFIDRYEVNVQELDKQSAFTTEEMKRAGKQAIESDLEGRRHLTDQMREELEAMEATGTPCSFATYEAHLTTGLEIAKMMPWTPDFRAKAAEVLFKNKHLQSDKAANECLLDIAGGEAPNLELLQELRNKYAGNLSDKERALFRYFLEPDHHIRLPYEEKKEIAAFQKDIFEDLMCVALPITGRSTGVNGIKWHHDKTGKLAHFSKNPHPLNYLPLKVFDVESGKWIQIIRFNDEGKRELTHKGVILLEGLSQKRET